MRRQAPVISNRRDLFDYLEEQMNRSYRQVLDTGRLETDSTFLKTLLLEFDWDDDDKRRDEAAHLSHALTVPASGRTHSSCTPVVSPTSEEGFYQVDWSLARSTIRIYLDTATDPERRFWLGYSLSDAAELDVLMDRIALSQAAFDRAWLWPELLRQTQALGEFRGVGLDYDYRRFEAQEGKPDSTSYFKMQWWGGPETQEILDFVSQQPAFRRWTVLAKVRMKYWADPDDRDQFALEDIKYNGKLTTRGTSFSTHQALVADLRSHYAEKVRKIEHAHTIRVSAEGPDDAVVGDPVFFNLHERPISNLDHFCQVVFSGHLPFRLWGLPREAPGPDRGRWVTAVDLHTGSKLFFEVYPDVVAMYLYPGACGNSVARFYTNLQHAFGRVVTGEDNEGRPVF